MSIKVTGVGRVNHNLDRLDDQMKNAVGRIFQYFAQVAENEMKVGARWTDRTGVARSGLVAEASDDGRSFTLNLASMASYGIWLEIRWSGKYAIVGPVMDHVGPQLAKMIADVALP
jgi:hypothetical protein